MDFLLVHFNHMGANRGPGATCDPVNSLIWPALPLNHSSKSQMRRVLSLSG